MTKEQLEGLSEVLPDGYPRQGGGIVVLDDDNKKHGSSKRRKRGGKPRPQFTPWYQRHGDW